VSFIVELAKFLKTRKKVWLTPIMVMLAIFGILLVLAQTTAVAPFIYTLF
jgi:drug/metabolite transporter superfamily protein YnfA